MDRLEQFNKLIKEEMTVTLATGTEGNVSMRAVSPVFFRGAVLIFTDSYSKKFRQLAENPFCCIAVGPFFAEARAQLLGETMRPENEALREAYCEKFPGAFDEGVEYGGRDAEFLLLCPTRLSGWDFGDEPPTPGAVPTTPFDIPLE